MPANWENSALATGLEKVDFSFQSQRKAMPKNAETTAQLHSSHTLLKYAQNSPSWGRSQDGEGIGWGDYFLFYKFIERTTER